MSKTKHRKTLDANWMVEFFISEKYRLRRHSLLVAFSILVLYYSPADYVEPFESYNRIVIFLQIILLAYSNMYFFVPKFLFRKKYVSYSLYVLSGMILSFFVHQIAAYYFRPYLLPYQDDDINFFTFSFMVMVLIIASASVKLFQQWIMDAQLINELERTNAQTELEQLKNQINPHFLFNMLNNANVLTQKDPEKASQVLVRLSDLLRYQLYDSAREKVLLTSDIHFLEDFLNLEKIRRDNFSFLISKEGNLSSIQIPPLLFISFVENAVKHNNDSARSSYVNVFFEIKDDALNFQCINSKPLLKAVSNSGGLGLTNTKRRLELLFPLNHTLKIVDDVETFTVYLTIKL
jgi:sensor histidine kinase YesM